jgi:hypothetical protein
MKRGLACSLFVFVSVAWISGCGGGGGGGFTGISSPSALNGQYAFVMSGFDATGNPMCMAGSLTADGHGHITAGAVDVNDNGTVVSSTTALAGTYSIGTDEQGTINITTNITGLAHTLAFAFSLQTSGIFGDIMDVSANNFVIAGTMQQQNSAIFSLSGLAGDYAITLNGRNSSNPVSVLGRFTLGSTGTSTNVVFDRSIAGVGTASSSGNSASLALTAPDTNGRGTLTISINDSPGGNTTQTFICYAITASRFIAVENDTHGTMTVDASRQNTPFLSTTVNTTGAVFGMSGIDTVAANEVAAVGQLRIASQAIGTIGFDSNDNGTTASILTLQNQLVTFDLTTGRGTFTVTNGTANGLANTLVFYLTAPGTGFILDGTAGATNRAMAGTLTAQTGSPFSLATDFSGLSVVRARASSANDAATYVGVFGPVSGSVSFELLTDERFPTNTGITTQTAQAIGLSASLTSSITGRGILTSGAGETLVFYVVGPNQSVWINTTAAEGSSPVFFASPQ